MSWMKYVGRENYLSFDDAVWHYKNKVRNGWFGMVSPGGAAMILGVSRQRIHQIITDYEDVTAFAFYESENKALSFCEIPVYEVVRYGVRTGRIESVSDMGLGMSYGMDMIEIAKAELEGRIEGEIRDLTNVKLRL